MLTYSVKSRHAITYLRTQWNINIEKSHNPAHPGRDNTIYEQYGAQTIDHRVKTDRKRYKWHVPREFAGYRDMPSSSWNKPGWSRQCVPSISLELWCLLRFWEDTKYDRLSWTMIREWRPFSICIYSRVRHDPSLYPCYSSLLSVSKSHITRKLS